MKGSYSQALTFFLSLPENCGSDPIETSYYIGLCYAKLKRYDDAMIYLEQVVTSTDPSTDEEKDRLMQCRYLLAVIYCLSGRKKMADFELKKLLDDGYREDMVYASLAFVAWENGDLELCHEYYERSLDIQEDNPTALNGYGYVLACEGKELTRALGYCKKALEMAPDSPAFLDSLGWVYYNMGLFGEAKKYLLQASKKDPENPIIKEHINKLEVAE